MKANNGDEDSNGRDKPSLTHRDAELDVNTTGDYSEITQRLFVNGSQPEQYRRAFRISNKRNSVDIVFRKQVNGSDSSFRFAFQRIHLFMPTNKTVGWQRKIDTAIKTWDFSNSSQVTVQSQPSCISSAPDTNNNTIVTCTAQVFDPATLSAPLFKLTAMLSSSKYTVSDGVTNSSHNASSMKFSVEINVPSTYNTTSYYVALVMKSRADASMDVGYNGYIQPGYANFGAQTQFIWEQTAWANAAIVADVITRPGTPEDVSNDDPIDASNTLNDVDRYFAFMFNATNATSIFWDPETGSDPVSEPSTVDTSSSSSTSFWTTGAIVGVAVGAAVFVGLVGAVIMKTNSRKLNA